MGSKLKGMVPMACALYASVLPIISPACRCANVMDYVMVAESQGVIIVSEFAKTLLIIMKLFVILCQYSLL